MPISPYAILKDAMRALPEIKYAAGIAGVASVVAIVAGFQLADLRIAIFGTIIVLGLMFVLVIFGALVAHAGTQLVPLALVGAWWFMTLTIATSFLLLTSYFFEWPRAIDTYIPKEKKISIHRRADFTRSGCDEDGNPLDIAQFDDEVTLSFDQSKYTAFTSLESHQRGVKVYDLSLANAPPVPPSQVEINGRKLNSYNITVVNKKAYVRYVWINSHFKKASSNDIGVIGITSKNYLANVSGEVLVNNSVNVEPVENPFDSSLNSKCERISNTTFRCLGLSNPDAVLFRFKWDLWSSCLSNWTPTKLSHRAQHGL